jgi:hypothetical protein
MIAKARTPSTIPARIDSKEKPGMPPLAEEVVMVWG